MKKIAFFDSKPYDIDSFQSTNKDYGYELKFFESKLNQDTASLAKGYEIVCAFVNDNLSKEVVDILVQGGTKLVAMRCAGYNNVDLSAVYKKLHVVRVPAYSPYAVAEHALALMMTLNRKTHKAYYRTKENNFAIKGLLGFDMFGKTAGVIGTGKIGLLLINILKGMGMKVLAYDLFQNNDQAKKIGFEYVSLEELYKQSDVISLHCPLSKETHHLINRDSINQMKEGVMIVNTGRGALIDAKALLDALKTKKIGAAGLDVYEEESEYFFEDFSTEIVNDDVLTRLLSFPNVLITSHQAFFTKEALSNIATTTFDNIKAFFNKKPLLNEVCYQCECDCVKVKDKNGRCW